VHGRRAILEVRRGPLAPRKVILQPGDRFCVGRSNVTEVPIARDARMSAEHFLVSWNADRCTVLDLGSADGTWLDGARVREAQLDNGAWIRAGETDFMVYFEAHTPSATRRRATPPDADQARAALAELERRREPLFAVVDGSRGPRPLRLLREAVDEHRSLYEGVRGDALADAAPYLVAFRRDSALLERLVREGWGSRWAVFLACGRPFNEVRRHLRRFLVVEDDDTGEPYYFRFYDPRTLRVFLPSCTPRQRADFFGDVDAFFAEDERGAIRAFPR
jgi:hypothetical protein